MRSQIIFTEHTDIVINILTGSAMAQAGSHGLSLQRTIANARPVHVGFVIEWDRLFCEYFSVCDSIIPPMSLLVESSMFFWQNRNLL